MRKNNNILEKLIDLKENRIPIAGYFIKEISRITSKGNAIIDLYCNFEKFNFTFTQNEFLSKSTNSLTVKIIVIDLPNAPTERLNQDAIYVFEELRSKYLKDELKDVLPTVGV